MYFFHYYLLFSAVDIAILVFNKCTSDNAGTMPNNKEEAITKDSLHFEITFDYEFLEDIKDSSTWMQNDNRKTHAFHFERRYSTLDTAKRVGTRNILNFSQTLGAHDTFKNDWGPAGFKKSNHPLNIMVSSTHLVYL